MYLGCHLIDILYRVQGEPLEVLPMNTSSGFGKGVGADEGFVLYRYPRGISFIRTTAVECGGFMRRRIVFYGEKGTIAVDPIERYDPAYPSLSSDYGEILLEDCRGSEKGEKRAFRSIQADACRFCFDRARRKTERVFPRLRGKII